MKLQLISSHSGRSPSFPLLLELQDDNRIVAPGVADHYMGNYCRNKEALLMSVVEWRYGLRASEVTMTLFSGHRRGRGWWEGVSVSTSLGQNPIFLPGTWSAREIGG